MKPAAEPKLLNNIFSDYDCCCAGVPICGCICVSWCWCWCAAKRAKSVSEHTINVRVTFGCCYSARSHSRYMLWIFLGDPEAAGKSETPFPWNWDVCRCDWLSLLLFNVTLSVLYKNICIYFSDTSDNKCLPRQILIFRKLRKSLHSDLVWTYLPKLQVFFSVHISLIICIILNEKQYKPKSY